MRVQYVISYEVMINPELPVSAGRYKIKKELFLKDELKEALARYTELEPEYAVKIDMQILHEHTEVEMIENKGFESVLPF